MLRKYFLLFFCSVTTTACWGQNLVPNPSFEDTVSCPYSTSQISLVMEWDTYGSSPDYYNSCAAQGGVSVPQNIYGHQYAATGNAYTGLVSFVMNDTIDSLQYTGREYIGAKLTSSLTIGQPYYVSFKVSFSRALDETCCAVSKLGLRFSMNPYTFDNHPPVNNSAHLYTNSIVTDSMNWTCISGWYVPDSAYQYINIGNFFENSLTDSIVYDTSLFASYYFIDDVCVSSDSSLCGCEKLSLPYSPIKNNYNLNNTVYPNPFSDNINIESPIQGDVTISVYDTYGRILWVQKRQKTTPSIFVDLTFLPIGNYLLKVDGNGIYHTHKIIKLN